MRCPTCGEEHELLDPVFGRPDIIFAMSGEEKVGRVVENNDVCARNERSVDLVRPPLPLRWRSVILCIWDTTLSRFVLSAFSVPYS
jgi:hypothetical protein